MVVLLNLISAKSSKNEKIYFNGEHEWTVYYHIMS